MLRQMPFELSTRPVSIPVSIILLVFLGTISKQVFQSSLVQWSALWFCNPQLADSNPVGDGQCYELFCEIAPTNRLYLLYFMYTN